MTLYKNKYRVESARLKGWDYTTPGFYFVTICTRGHACFFGEVAQGKMHLSPAGEIVADEWIKTESIRPNVKMDAWVVMPNHVHGIVQIVETLRRNVSTGETTDAAATTNPGNMAHATATTNPANPSRLKSNSLGSIVGQIKMQCTKRIRAVGVPEFDWQERFWDEILWDARGLTRVRQYIENNPRNWNTDRHKSPGLWM